MSSKLWICFAVFALALSPLRAESVEELVAKHLAARGGEARIKAIRSARLRGTLSFGHGRTAPMTLEWARPGRLRLEFTLQGMTGIQAFDGERAWTAMPFHGAGGPEWAPEEERARLAESADFDGPLVDWAAKGHRLESVGRTSIEGSEVFELRLTRKSGEVSSIYLDAETFLTVKEIGKTVLQGVEHTFESSVGDYKEVGGALFSFWRERRLDGAAEGQVTAIDSIELDVEIPAERFQAPEELTRSGP